LTAEKKVFVRKATGLVREIGAVTAILIILCNTIGLGWQKRIFQFSGMAPLPQNLWLGGINPMLMAFIIAGVIIFFSMLAVAILTTAMPRSGGGYVAISRLLSPFWAYFASWFEFLSISWSFGIIAVAVFEAVYFIFGPIVGVTAAGVNDVALFAGGLVLVLLFTAVACFGVRMTGLLLSVIFWIPAILTVYVLYLLVMSYASPGALSSGISMLAQAQGIAGVTADTYVKGALAQGLDAASIGNYWSAVSVAMIGAYWAYIGYAASSFVAGEIKETSKNIPRTLAIASVIIIAVYLTVSSLAGYSAAALGRVTLANGNTWSFFEAYSFLSYGGGNLVQAGVPAIKGWSSTIAAMTGIGLGLGSLNWLIFIFAVLWVANDIPPFILTASRLLFALAFDRVLPASLANVNERFHAPVNAVIATAVFGLLGVFSEAGVISAGGSWNPGGVIGGYLNVIFASGVQLTDFYDFIFFAIFTLALVVLPYRRPKIYETAPFKLGGKTGVVLIGVIGTLGNFVGVYIMLTAPTYSFNFGAWPNMTADNWFCVGFTLAIAILSYLVYAYYKYGPASKTVDYRTIFTEIPPE